MVFGFAARDDFKAFDELDGFGSVVRFNEPDNDIDAFGFKAVSLLEHHVRFANAGAIAEVDLQPAPLGAADELKECLCAVFCHAS
jgi:hypothetical protein